MPLVPVGEECGSGGLRFLKRGWSGDTAGCALLFPISPERTARTLGSKPSDVPVRCRRAHRSTGG